MSLERLAIDIALLPPDGAMDEIIAVNQELVARYDSAIVLNDKYCLPHVSLSQAVIGEKDMPEATSRLGAIAVAFKPIELSGKLIQSGDNVHLSLAPSGQLQALHEQIMVEFADLLSYDAEEEDFYDPVVQQRTISYVNSFSRGAAYENFNPHVTVGKGQLEDLTCDLAFTAARLAISPIGDNTTCREILVEAALGRQV